MRDLEGELHALFRDKESQAPAAKPLSEYMGEGAGRQSRRWQWLAIPAAVGLTTAVVVGVAALPNPPDSRLPVVAGSPSASTSAIQGHGALGSSTALSCVEEYSPRAVTGRSFAFDGTITDIGPGTTNRDGFGQVPLRAVTFIVNEWFLGGTGETVTVDMAAPADDPLLEDGPSYGIGTRLVVSGEPRWGGLDSTADGLVWGCGFTRYWDQQTADAWRAGVDDWVDSLRPAPCWATGFNSGVPDYGAPRPVDDTQPIELAARMVEGTGLSKQYPQGRLVISDVGDDLQSILLVDDDQIVGQFSYMYGDYGWEATSLDYC